MIKPLPKHTFEPIMSIKKMTLTRKVSSEEGTVLSSKNVKTSEESCTGQRFSTGTRIRMRLRCGTINSPTSTGPRGTAPMIVTITSTAKTNNACESGVLACQKISSNTGFVLTSNLFFASVECCDWNIMNDLL